MIKHLTPHGNSAALVIDKPILELLHINMETDLEIKTDGSVLIISPLRDEERKVKFDKAVDRVMGKHKKTLSKLARSPR